MKMLLVAYAFGVVNTIVLYLAAHRLKGTECLALAIILGSIAGVVLRLIEGKW